MSNPDPECPLSERLKTLSADLSSLAQRGFVLEPTAIIEICKVVDLCAEDCADIEQDVCFDRSLSARLKANAGRVQALLSDNVVILPTATARHNKPTNDGDAA